MEEYKKEVLRNEAPYLGMREKLQHVQTQRGLHASLGIGDEAGEILAAYKKHLIYGKVLDRVNVIEEAGDLLWYLVILLDSVESSIPEAMEVNVKKLQARYKDGFTPAEALTRNLDNERKVLEQAANNVSTEQTVDKVTHFDWRNAI